MRLRKMPAATRTAKRLELVGWVVGEGVVVTKVPGSLALCAHWLMQTQKIGRRGCRTKIPQVRVSGGLVMWRVCGEVTLRCVEKASNKHRSKRDSSAARPDAPEDGAKKTRRVTALASQNLSSIYACSTPFQRTSK